MSLRFEWDREKARSNLSRHAVSFEEALTVFANPMARIFDDEDHSLQEEREIIIGHSAKERLLVICFTSQGELESLVHERQQPQSGRTMKKTSGHRRPMRDEMRREYRFDYRKSRPNRFAPLMKRRTVAVVLDPDIAAV